MKIDFITDSIAPMYEWLKDAKEKGIRDETKLRTILSDKNYQIEFQRYGEEGLPVCGINFEESVDFFMHFDQKEFSNQRLQIKQKYFQDFYNYLDEKMKTMELFTSFSKEDKEIVLKLLENGLPNNLVKNEIEYKILFIISIGNSMGWPYKNYIDFDIANLQFISEKKTFLHILAHEIHHTMFGNLIPEDMKPEEFFLLNFAFEGLAVHFNNNARTLVKPSKYEDEMVGIDLPTWNFYDENFEELFKMLKEDYQQAKKLTIDKVGELISNHYEQFTFTSKKTGKKIMATHYPTYYLGCHFFGLIDLAFGKETLFKAMMNPSTLVETYNEACKKTGNTKYLF